MKTYALNKGKFYLNIKTKGDLKGLMLSSGPIFVSREVC